MENIYCMVVEFVLGRKAFVCKWVFSIKCNDDGGTDRYKARVVARWYSKVEGVD